MRTVKSIYEKVDTRLREGIDKLKRGGVLITGKNQYIKYKGQSFVLIELLDGKVNTETLSETAVRTHLYFENDWK